jgi:hypothetical protein
MSSMELERAPAADYHLKNKIFLKITKTGEVESGHALRKPKGKHMFCFGASTY